jgi:uncharacterized RDD family membrane protein YckC
MPTPASPDPAPSPDQAVATAPPVTAPLWPRFGALVYEAVLLFGVVFLASWIFVVTIGDATQGALRLVHSTYLATVVGVYFVYCWRRTGQTLPMKTWGLRLIATDGAIIPLWKAIARYVLALLGLLAVAAGFLWAFVDPDRQFLHDRLLGTRIVRAPI